MNSELLFWQVSILRMVDLDESDESSSDDTEEKPMPPPKPSACAKVSVLVLKKIIHAPTLGSLGKNIQLWTSLIRLQAPSSQSVGVKSNQNCNKIGQSILQNPWPVVI